jgi:hypothetical protein
MKMTVARENTPALEDILARERNIQAIQRSLD